MRTAHDIDPAADRDRRLWWLGGLWLVGLAWSGWRPFDRPTWWMEVAPALVAWPLLVWLGRRWRLTTLSLALIAVHGLVLMLGGAYTYARVPVGHLVQEWLALDRNPYDRFGHFMQGFVPAVVLREALLRRSPLAPGALLTTLVLACCLAISAAYELVEFAAAADVGPGCGRVPGRAGRPRGTPNGT